MVNKTELKAIQWLKKTQGYKEQDIIKNSNKSPDFVCSDGKRYEVKLMYKDQLIFYDSQVRDLKNSDYILVFDKDGEFIKRFKWGERDKIHLKIKIITKENITSIQLEKKTLLRLKELRLTKRESYEEIINRLIDRLNGQNKVKKEVKK